MVRLAEMLAAQDRTSELFGGTGSNSGKDMVVQRDGGGMIAAAEARNVAYLHVFGARIGKGGLQCGAQLR